MNRIEELLHELCPEGVEYFELKSICGFQNGFAFKSSLYRDCGHPILRITNIVSNVISDEDCVYFDLKDYKEDLSSYVVKKNNIVIAMSGATTGKIGFNSSDNVYYLNQRVGLFRPYIDKLNNRYLYHWLLTKQNCLLQMSSGTGAQPNLSTIKMMELRIPVPPLPVQEEIVRILDKFTDLTTDLTRELALRRKQYEYYRDQLLTFDTEVEWKTLGECTVPVRNIKWSEHLNKEFKYIDLNSVDIDTNSIGETQIITADNAPSRAQQIVKKNDILLGTTRPLLKRYCVVPESYDNEICSTGFCVLRNNGNDINYKYLYYVVSASRFFDYVRKFQRGAAYPAISDKDVKNYEFPVPPLPVQQRIVNVLDNFEAVCSDLKIGLPAEIEVRQKQYEYYRDLLLTFTEKGAITQTDRQTDRQTEHN